MFPRGSPGKNQNRSRDFDFFRFFVGGGAPRGPRTQTGGGTKIAVQNEPSQIGAPWPIFSPRGHLGGTLRTGLFFDRLSPLPGTLVPGGGTVSEQG